MGSKAKEAEPLGRQVAALPLRLGRASTLEVLLITSRETQRWVLPKGNRMKGRTKAQAAAAEAIEEAGVSGRIEAKSTRRYTYWKRREDGFFLQRVDVFLLFDAVLEEDWQERDERSRLWVPVAFAAQLVLEPGLQALLLELSRDKALHRRLKEECERNKTSERAA